MAYGTVPHMGELAPWHLIILVVIILLLFGAKRIPDLARSVGSGMREFKDGVTGAPEKDPAETADAPDKVDPPV